MRNRKNLITLIIALLLFSFEGMSQNNTSSPYSRFGIGDLNPQGTGRNKAMGGTGIALRSNRTLNNLNPASYTALDSMSFILEFGAKAGFSQFKTNLSSATQNNSEFNFDYLQFAFPVTHWWGASMGVSHLSDVGYTINQLEENQQTGNIRYNYSGSGGLNRAYISNGVRVFPNLSLGMSVNYVFGVLKQNKNITFETTNSAAIEAIEEAQVRDFAFDFGAQYHGKLSSHYDMVLGAVFSKKSSLSADYSNTTLKTTPFINGTGISSRTDTLIHSSENRIVDLPQSYGMGFAVTKDKRLTLALDYQHQNWSDAVFLGQKDTLQNSNNWAFGVEYTPNANSIRSYFKRVVYRVGGHYTNSYLKIRGEQLKDYGISVGASFPLKRLSTYITLAVEMGRRGTLEQNLIREDYAKVSVNFSLFEHWFVKRKFD